MFKPLSFIGAILFGGWAIASEPKKLPVPPAPVLISPSTQINRALDRPLRTFSINRTETIYYSTNY